jgi:RNA polymerase sigma factor (sigma-70 family)
VADLLEDAIRLHYRGTLRKFTYLVRRAEAAEDMTQEVYLRLARHTHLGRRIEDPAGFVRGIEQRVFREYLKAKKKSSAVLSLVAEVTEKPGLEEPFRLEIEEVNGRMKELLESMDQEDQQLLVGTFMMGISTAELGALLGVPRQTARSRLVRAVERLRSRVRAAGVTL